VRTDVILNLPGGRHLVVDSKVSLTAYTDCSSATEDEPRRAALKLHLASVRGHVAGLAQAGYHRLTGVEGPDFVVMFVPVEPAFLLALQNDGDLWSEAYKKGILLVGPTTLLYVIRIIDLLWKQQQQSRNVDDVMKQGGALYDKFVNFVSDMEAVGKSLRGAETSYAEAMSKLSEGRGNLIRRVEMLRKLNVSSTKQLSPRLLDAAHVDAADEDEPILSIAAEADQAISTE
jgi:DNA recombination protein RmuC